MIDVIAEIKKMFPTGTYHPPCTDAEIVEAEELLGQKLPDVLRIIYSHFNGFSIWDRGIGIYPLLPRHANTSTVKMTLFWKNDPYMPVKDNIIFFGDSSKYHNLGIRLTPPEAVVEYSPDLEEPHEMGKTILDAFRIDEEWFQGLNLPPTSPIPKN